MRSVRRIARGSRADTLFPAAGLRDRERKFISHRASRFDKALSGLRQSVQRAIPSFCESAGTVWRKLFLTRSLSTSVSVAANRADAGSNARSVRLRHLAGFDP